MRGRLQQRLGSLPATTAKKILHKRMIQRHHLAGGAWMMICLSATTATRVLNSKIVSKSCVTITTVRSSSRCRLCSSVQKPSALSGSSPAVGSSSSSSGGSITSARASATRLTMPPDKSAGILCAWRASSPTICSLHHGHIAHQLGRQGAQLAQRKGNVLQHRERRKQRAVLEQHADPAGRTGAAQLGRRVAQHLHLPRAGVSSPSICRSSTVLPLPEPPTMDSISPRSTCKFRSVVDDGGHTRRAELRPSSSI